jgi:hypothetical protein
MPPADPFEMSLTCAFGALGRQSSGLHQGLIKITGPKNLLIIAVRNTQS